MAILNKTTTNTKADPMEIPPELRRTNGKATPDTEALLARIAQLEAQVARKSTLTLKVSEKGAVSLYGLGRFPVSLYGEQWSKVLAMKEEIEAFIEAHKAELSTK
jgi:hypothetical protein